MNRNRVSLFKNLKVSGKYVAYRNKPSRSMPVVNSIVGIRFPVHNGRLERSLKITPRMEGYSLGSFIDTRSRFVGKGRDRKDKFLRRRLSKSRLVRKFQ